MTEKCTVFIELLHKAILTKWGLNVALWQSPKQRRTRVRDGVGHRWKAELRRMRLNILKKKKKTRRETRDLCFRSTGADVPADEHRGGLSETMTVIHRRKQSHLWKSSAHKTSSACKHQEPWLNLYCVFNWRPFASLKIAVWWMSIKESFFSVIRRPLCSHKKCKSSLAVVHIWVKTSTFFIYHGAETACSPLRAVLDFVSSRRLNHEEFPG